MKPDDATLSKAATDDGPDTAITTLKAIEDQGRETLELLHRMLALLLPKEVRREGPSLEQILAQLIAQQREVINITRATQDELHRMQETMPRAVADAVEEHRHFMRRPN